MKHSICTTIIVPVGMSLRTVSHADLMWLAGNPATISFNNIMACKTSLVSDVPLMFASMRSSSCLAVLDGKSSKASIRIKRTKKWPFGSWTIPWCYWVNIWWIFADHKMAPSQYWTDGVLKQFYPLLTFFIWMIQLVEVNFFYLTGFPDLWLGVVNQRE